MKYFKEVEKTDGRVLRTGGPRDLQKQQKLDSESSFLIERLRKEIDGMKTQPVMQTAVSEGLFTPEQVDEEIRKAVKDALNESKEGYGKKAKKIAKELIEAEAQIKELKDKKNSEIKALLEEQNRKIEELSRLRLTDKGEYEDPERPKIEEVFIDPLEDDAGERLIPHIEIEDVSTAEKEKMQDKVDKLKELMNGLPAKKKR